MKHIALFTLMLLAAATVFSQAKPQIQKSWVKTSVEDLSGRATAPGTLYTRYTFSKAALYISFYPGWDDYHQSWSLEGNKLTIGFDTYTVEDLTDTSLVIAIEGFRRYRFLSEDYLSSKEEYLIPVGEYNGKPLYRANHYITPRYDKKTSLRSVVQKNVEGFNIKKATYFAATFVITEEGKVENVQIVSGITEGFNKEVIRQLLKTSKDWKPALFRGKPVQTQMVYDIKYLDSITPFGSGRL